MMIIRTEWEGLKIEEMVGKTALTVTNIDNCELVFAMDDGSQYIFWHNQDCCESVRIEDICGNLSDLEDSPILLAETVTNSDNPPNDGRYVDSFTWTFYKFSTMKGDVTVRWYGESNGYYSEGVDMKHCIPERSAEG